MNTYDQQALQQQLDAMLRRGKTGKRADRRAPVKAAVHTDDNGDEWAVIAVKLKDVDLDGDELPLWLQRERR